MVGAPARGSPGELITDVRESTRSGCSIAIVCTIIPPIEAPRMWARSMPSASSRPNASLDMSESVYGVGGAGSPASRACITAIGSMRCPSNFVDSPQSRLSNRTTW